MPWSSGRRLPSALCQLAGSTVVAGRDVLAGEGVSVSPCSAPVPCVPPDPHPRSSISACTSTGTVTDTLAGLGLFMLWGHQGVSLGTC